MDKDFKSLSKEFIENAQGIKNNITEIRDSTNDFLKALSGSSKHLVNWSAQYTQITNSANALAGIQDTVTKRAKGTVDALKEQNKLTNEVKNLNGQIYNLYLASASAKGKEKYILEGVAKNLAAARDNAQDLAKNYGTIAEDSATLDKRTQFFSSISEVARDIPGLRKLSEPFNAAAQASREAVIHNAKLKADLNLSGKSSNVMMSGLKAGFKALGPIIKGVLGPLALIGAAMKIIQFFKEAMFAASKETADFSKNFLVSRDSARNIRDKLSDTLDTYNSIATIEGRNTILRKDYLATLNSINGVIGLQLDLVTGFGEQMGKNVGEATEMMTAMGYSGEAATRLVLESSRLNKSTESYNNTLIGTLALEMDRVGLLGNASQIMEEAVKISGNLRANFKNNTIEIARSVFQSKLLGLNLNQMEGVTNKLLNFESSISSEMQAEMLTGKRLNLDKARGFALMGDTTNLMKEINREAGTYQDFLNMNILARQSLAESLGMDLDSLAEMYRKQEDINTLMSYSQRLKSQGYEASEEYLKKFSGGMADIIKKAKEQTNDQEKQVELIGEELKKRQATEDAQTKFNKSLERAKESFATLVNGGLIDRLSVALERMIETIIRWTGSREDKRNLRISKGITAEEKKTDKTFTEEQVKEYKKNYVKQEAVNRQVVDPFDMRKSTKTPIKVDDFIIRPGQVPLKFNKGDIVMGGTNLGGGDTKTIQLLERLVAIAEKGGIVLLDGQKVGQTLINNSYKLQ